MKLLKFESSHCGMCKAMEAQLKQLKAKYTSIDVETEEGEELANEFAIRNLPTLVKLSDDNKEMGRTTLSSVEQLKDFIKI